MTAGGPISAGQTYLVGERGPEMLRTPPLPMPPPESDYEHPDLGVSELYRAPNLGSQEVGGSERHPVEYILLGLMMMMLVPAVIISVPIWVPALVIGWAAVKIARRFGVELPA